MRLRIWQKILAILILPILFEVAFVLALGGLLRHAESVSAQFERSRAVTQSFDIAVNAILQSFMDINASVNNAGSTSPSQAAFKFDSMLVAIRNAQRTIASSVDVRPEIADVVKDAPDIFDQTVRVLDKAKLIYADSSIPMNKKPAYFRREAFMVMLELKPVINQMLTASSRLETLEPQELSRLRSFIVSLTITGLLISLGLSAALARIMFKDIVRRVEMIQENAQLVASGKPLLPLVGGGDEIADLDRSLHSAAIAIAEGRRKEFAILEKSLDVLFSLNQKHRFVAVGDSVVNAWRLRPDELLGRSFLTLLPQGVAPRAVRALAHAAGAGVEEEFETELRCGDGTMREILWRIGFQSSSKTFHCIAHDISERRLLERKRQELIAVAGRKLSTPLNAVSERLGRAAAQHVPVTPDTLGKMFSRSDTNIERLTALINDLLDIEQMETGKIVLNTDRVAARSVCESAIAAVQPLALRLGIKISSPEIDAEILADRRKIEQVLVNLLSNAVKYSPRGSAIAVRIAPVDDLIEISVADQGPGIEEADRELIFERFYQTKAQSTSGIKSTGLGLTIAKLIAQAHNGTIGVESEIGKGSRFWLQLPPYGDRG